MNLRSFISVIFAVVSISQSACSRESNPITVKFRGQITEKSVQDFSNAIESIHQDQAIILQITSEGGDALAGIKMGEIINQRKIFVLVNEYCISACAQYVFLASPHKEVANHSLVLFHGSMNLLFNVLNNTNEPKGARILENAAKLEENFLKKVGIKPQFFSAALYGIQPQCVAFDDKKDVDDAAHYGLQSHYQTYTLSRNQIEYISNSKIDGFWPSGPDEIINARNFIPFDQRLTINWLGDRGLSIFRNLGEVKLACKSHWNQ